MNSCQQMIIGSPVRQHLPHQQRLPPTSSLQHNGFNQRIGTQQSAVTQQQQMSTQLFRFGARQLQRSSFRPNNMQQNPIVRTQASNQIQPTSMHSLSISPVVSSFTI